MLQYLGTGDISVLGDMADEDDRHAALLREAQQHCRHLLYLANAAGSGLDSFGEHSLHRIHYHQFRADLLRLCNDGFYLRFGEDQCLLVTMVIGRCAPCLRVASQPCTGKCSVRGYFSRRKGQPVRPHLHLTRTLLARNIQRLEPRRQGNLQTESRFANARFTADQHQRPWHYATAQKPVDFR